MSAVSIVSQTCRAHDITRSPICACWLPPTRRSLQSPTPASAASRPSATRRWSTPPPVPRSAPPPNRNCATSDALAVRCVAVEAENPLQLAQRGWTTTLNRCRIIAGSAAHRTTAVVIPRSKVGHGQLWHHPPSPAYAVRSRPATTVPRPPSAELRTCLPISSCDARRHMSF